MQHRINTSCKIGFIDFGEIDVECYVLEEGRRLLSKRGALKALGGGGPNNAHLERALERIPAKYKGKSVGPNFVEFECAGGTAHGIDAEAFIDICLAYEDAANAGALRASQMHFARNARKILRACSKVGIAALIDEATGYQSIRPHDDVQRLFSRVLRDKPGEWVRRYSPSFVDSMCKLYGHPRERGRFPRWLSPIIFKFYQIVLGDALTRELHGRCPSPQAGNVKHQWLQNEIQRVLERDIVIAEVIAKQSRTPEEFWNRMSFHYRGTPLQMHLECA